MKITQEADYALRVILYLSKLDKGAKESARVISEKENIPLRFLLKLLQKLRKAGIVKSYMGVNGGYALNKKPQDITFKDVIEAVDGPIYINRCLYNPAECNLDRANHCNVHNALASIQENLKKNLESINFENVQNDFDCE